MSTFKERLARAAVHAGVGSTQSAIADALELSRQAVNKWFIGTAEPSAENLLEIAKKWRVSAEWLQSGEGEMLSQPSSTLPADERELLRSYRSAAPEMRPVLRKMVRFAKKSALFLVATIPPLMSPSTSEAGTLHNTFAAVQSYYTLALNWFISLCKCEPVSQT